MNYLAHIYLSGPDPEVQVGGLLGDFVKGPLPAGYSERIEAGIALHRRIDALTDRDPRFRARLAALPSPWRRFGGILLDVYFDHLLASRWQVFHPRPLEQFCGEFYRQLRSRHGQLPERARHFCRRAPEVRWLESYAEPDRLPPMLNNLGRRLRRPVPLGDAWPLLEAQRRELEPVFEGLMADHRRLARTFLQDNL